MRTNDGDPVAQLLPIPQRNAGYTATTTFQKRRIRDIVSFFLYVQHRYTIRYTYTSHLRHLFRRKKKLPSSKRGEDPFFTGISNGAADFQQEYKLFLVSRPRLYQLWEMRLIEKATSRGYLYLWYKVRQAVLNMAALYTRAPIHTVLLQRNERRQENENNNPWPFEGAVQRNNWFFA